MSNKLTKNNKNNKNNKAKTDVNNTTNKIGSARRTGNLISNVIIVGGLSVSLILGITSGIKWLLLGIPVIILAVIVWRIGVSLDNKNKAE